MVSLMVHIFAFICVGRKGRIYK